MAKPQVSQSFWKRSGGWCKRHKVKAAFSFLLVLIVLVAVEGWVQTQISIHFERERFQTASQKLHELSRQLNSVTNLSVTQDDNCSYTSFGGVFEAPSRGCSSDVFLAKKDIPKSLAMDLTNQMKNVLKNQGVKLSEVKGVHNEYDLSVWGFSLNRLDCVFSATYYDERVTLENRYAQSPKEGRVLLIDLGCSGPARAEYFPVK